MTNGFLSNSNKLQASQAARQRKNGEKERGGRFDWALVRRGK